MNRSFNQCASFTSFLSSSTIWFFVVCMCGYKYIICKYTKSQEYKLCPKGKIQMYTSSLKLCWKRSLNNLKEKKNRRVNGNTCKTDA